MSQNLFFVNSSACASIEEDEEQLDIRFFHSDLTLSMFRYYFDGGRSCAVGLVPEEVVKRDDEMDVAGISVPLYT